MPPGDQVSVSACPFGRSHTLPASALVGALLRQKEAQHLGRCVGAVAVGVGAGRIAAGTSNDLATRAADVILKERRRLILVLRDTPYSLIHINNMKLITEAGGIICPATPSFYSKPATFEALAATVVDRVLDLAGLDLKSYRWGEER